MARVFIDACIVGEEWFREVVEELVDSKGVRFSFTDHPRMLSELAKNRKLGELYKRAGDMGRRDDVDSAATGRHIDFLTALSAWNSESACDDEHVFAIVFEKPTPFIFTGDGRIATCRDCINRSIDSRYCNFRLVRSRANYEEKRQEILN